MNSSFMEKLAYFESLQNKSDPKNIIETPISVDTVNQTDILIPKDIDEPNDQLDTIVTNYEFESKDDSTISPHSDDVMLYSFTEVESYIVSPPIKKRSRFPMKTRPLPPIRKKKSNHYYCSRCKIVFSHEDIYNEHLLTHKNQENDMCICNKCKRVFNDDIDYSSHLAGCTENNTSDIPSDPLGKYNCPLCENRYSNSFLLGEHFVISHTEYEVLTTLDEKQWNGFPGFDILERINMIEFTKVSEEKCEICFYNFDNNIVTDDKEIDNRSPLTLKCCHKLICYDCLRNHLSITNSVICPYCTKDHTQTNTDYIIFIDEDNNIDKTRWDSWWIDHLDIFIPKIF